jgi:hypothetical protein
MRDLIRLTFLLVLGVGVDSQAVGGSRDISEGEGKVPLEGGEVPLEGGADFLLAEEKVRTLVTRGCQADLECKLTKAPQTTRSLQKDEDDDEDDGLHVNFLTTCIMPFRTYVPSEENMYRIPFGNVRITFDGGQGIFNNITRGNYPGYDPALEFTFEYDLQGLPSNCDGCRIQVNDGADCTHPDIRFWDRSVEGAENPWRPEYGAVYHSSRQGQARGYFSMFDGFEYADHKGRTVVVFDSDLITRIGCGVIRRREYGECGNEPNSGPSMLPSLSPIVVTVPPGQPPTPAPQPTFPSAPTNPPAQPTQIPSEPTNLPAQPTRIPSEPTNPPQQPTRIPSESTNPPQQPTQIPSAPTNPPQQQTQYPSAPFSFDSGRPTPRSTKRPETPRPTPLPTNEPMGKGHKGGKGSKGSSSKDKKDGKKALRRRNPAR